MNGIDLHVHTLYSDGTFSPGEAIRVARERELQTVAITDHDTIDGLPEAFQAGAEAGVRVVPGVEFSTVHDGEGIHVLAYYMDLEDAAFLDELGRLRADRLSRAERMVEKLQDLGYPVTIERVREIAAGGTVVRPHVARAMVEAGVVPSVQDAFSDRFIGTGGPAYVEKHALDPVVAMALIHRAGGVCVLAHPGTWREADPVPMEFIRELIEAGLDGIEARHPEHTPELEARFVSLAEGAGIFWTGSSDCHGTLYDPVRMGARTTPPDQFERLKQRAAELRLAAREP
ncbi:MAG TPA: PHP domain-containing protein [Actinomycetota bacterium]|nr:PHP domain-containing protein [Actinomycetota bacterium]